MPLRPFLLLSLCLTVLAPAAQAQAGPRLVPVDEAASVPDFFSFRARLQAAVARHDTTAVLAVLAPKAELSFGGDHGPQDFRRMWKPDMPGSPLWPTLATVLALGGSFDRQGRFVAPYVVSNWPDDADSYTNVAALDEGVSVHAAASDGAPVIARLDFSVIGTADQSGEPAGWTALKLPSGQTGHVRSTRVRSPLDYRIRFSRQPAGWRIDYFIAGD